MSENPADQHATPPQPAEDGGIPSATVPGASVQPHGGDESPHERQDGTYVDGNLDVRGDVVAGRPQVSPDGERSLDDDLDTSPRTDGSGRPAKDPAQ